MQSGNELWSHPFGPVFPNNWGDGPRGTPTVDGDLVFAIGGQSNLICCEAASGKRRWDVSLLKDLQGKVMTTWGYTESPLVDGDRVICTPGGVHGTLAALDKNTSQLVWRTTDLKAMASYSSMILAEVNGVRQYIQLTGSGTVGVAAKDGKVLWRSKLVSNTIAVIPTPIYRDNYVYVTASYNSGCALLHLVPDGEKFKAEPVYVNKNMKNMHGGVVLVGDHIFGFSERDGWVCQEFKTGKIVWTEKKKLSSGCLTCADGQLYCYGERDGTVCLIEASPDGWKENGRFRIPRQTDRPRKSGQIWTHPVISDGRLYLRDQDLIFCFDIRE